MFSTSVLLVLVHTQAQVLFLYDREKNVELSLSTDFVQGINELTVPHFYLSSNWLWYNRIRG